MIYNEQSYQSKDDKRRKLTAGEAKLLAEMLSVVEMEELERGQRRREGLSTHATGVAVVGREGVNGEGKYQLEVQSTSSLLAGVGTHLPGHWQNLLCWEVCNL